MRNYFESFSLIEMIIIVAILGILAAIAIPLIGGIHPERYTVTCYSGDKVIYEGPGRSIEETNGCMVRTETSKYSCTACAERKN